MPCLLFDAPKSNKGFIHYKPLKMCKPAVRFLGIFEQGIKKFLPKITLGKSKRWLSVGKRTPSSFWLRNVVSLPSITDRGNGMKSQKRGWCPRYF